MSSSRGGGYGPPDASGAPRYTGIRTFARCPHVRSPERVDVAAVGVPFDTTTSFRPGARFGPEAIRSASSLLRAWHPVLEVDVFAGRSVVDYGDLDVTPGNAERTADQVATDRARTMATNSQVRPVERYVPFSLDRLKGVHTRSR